MTGRAKAFFAVVLLALMASGACSRGERAGKNRVTRVIDGDTVVLDGRESVRLIGVDCPELRRGPRSEKAKARSARRIVTGLALGKQVRVELDGETTDRYGRTLGYIRLEDGTSLNETIIRNGTCRVLTRYPFAKMQHFLQLQERARAERIGMWEVEADYVE